MEQPPPQPPQALAAPHARHALAAADAQAAPHALAALERDVAALCEAWEGAMPARGAVGGAAQVEVEQMSDPGLMRVTDALAQVRRDIDAVLARVAAEVTKRSGPEFGDIGMAKAQGFHNPARLIAASTRASRADALRLITVGTVTAQRQTFSGERLPSRHPHVAAAVEAAKIGIEAASAITSMLDRASAQAEASRVDLVEAALVELAGRVPLETLLRGVREAEARLDPDGVEPREDELCTERSLTMREDGRGMVHLHARLDPESAAPVKAAIEALVTDVLRRREPADGDPIPVADDRRSIPQIQADALAALARHTLGCAQTLTPLAKATVVVRVDLDTLVSGLGHARMTVSINRSPLPRPAAWRPTPSSFRPCSGATASRSTSDGPLGCSRGRNASRSASATVAALRVARTSPTSRPTTSTGGNATRARPISRTASCSAASATT
ncbi:uncharacterized protein DUF222 [Agromyces ramosus]|uniref:Uncharacterized protein DUF222 n=1 Tax=Agromyces ramosus TaxID=33879 RepID=A0A4V2F004_9MICO|nr:DUF222 domain-containing protein [Agromyces ramosus]RZS68300.1 uncharacterized protein DUF222 [Agromyces ramosus]